jgi:hypothetical protein
MSLKRPSKNNLFKCMSLTLKQRLDFPSICDMHHDEYLYLSRGGYFKIITLELLNQYSQFHVWKNEEQSRSIMVNLCICLMFECLQHYQKTTKTNFINIYKTKVYLKQYGNVIFVILSYFSKSARNFFGQKTNVLQNTRRCISPIQDFEHIRKRFREKSVF